MDKRKESRRNRDLKHRYNITTKEYDTIIGVVENKNLLNKAIKYLDTFK